MKRFTCRTARCLLPLAAAAAIISGCNTKHTITVEPIYMKLDVNVKLDRELDQAFDYQERIEEQWSATSTAPAIQSENGEPGGESS